MDFFFEIKKKYFIFVTQCGGHSTHPLFNIPADFHPPGLRVFFHVSNPIYLNSNLYLQKGCMSHSRPVLG